MMKNETRSKEQIVESIIRQDFYQPDSITYKLVHAQLSKLSRTTLENLEMVMTMRVAESCRTALHCDQILRTSQEAKK